MMGCQLVRVSERAFALSALDGTVASIVTTPDHALDRVRGAFVVEQSVVKLDF